MARYKVVVSDQVFPTVELERDLLAEIDADLIVASGPRDEVLALTADADAVLNTYLAWDAGAIASLQNCKIIARYGIGFDNVDLDAARERGIIVTNVPDYSVQEVATHALALILATLRKIVEADLAIRDGISGVDAFRPIRRLSTMKVGFVGFGRIARYLAAPLAALGAELIVYDPYLTASSDLPPLLELDDLLSEADIITLHSPLTDSTRGMIGASQIDRMKSDAILINTSRGPLVDLDALTAALKAGAIAAAGLDVFDVEPLDESRIKGVPNLIATPHMAYYSEQALQESQRKATTQVIKVLSGDQPDYQVN